MKVELITATASLAALEPGWNRLARNPFCNWDWLAPWWRHYCGTIGGGDAQLFVLCVYDGNGSLAAVAPWYLQRSAAQGRVVRFLGCGEVWSDHLTVPCREGFEGGVAEALAGWLTPQAHGLGNGAVQGIPRWDLLDLRGIDATDAVLIPLARCLAARGCSIRQQQEEHCWQIPLPDRWESYLRMLSKSHRKQLRQLQRRYFDTGHAVLHTVEEENDLRRAWPILIRLHQQRFEALGEQGCFASPVFSAYHREVAARMLARNQLHLHWLELNGQPIAADYHLAQDGVIYVYQGGIAPAALVHEPGRLITMAALQRAIRQGYRAFDFLRGDEPYKAHWRAVPRAAVRLQVVAGRASAQLRYGLCSAPTRGKKLIKRGWQSVLLAAKLRLRQVP